MAKKGVKVFLDSNVIISGLFSDRGAPRVILDLFSLGLPVLTCATGEYNIVEIERNLTKKMPDVLPIYRKYLPLLNLELIPFPPEDAVRKLAGLTADTDIPVLASAISGNVDFLVTGDKKDFVKVKGKYSFRILSPAEFLEAILPEILKAGKILDIGGTAKAPPGELPSDFRKIRKKLKKTTGEKAAGK